jgi:hypothetical protein
MWGRAVFWGGKDAVVVHFIKYYLVIDPLNYMTCCEHMCASDRGKCFKTKDFFKLATYNVQVYFHLLMLHPIFICTRLIPHSSKKFISKYDFEELRQHMHIILLRFCVSTKLFLHTSPLNNKSFINI